MKIVTVLLFATFLFFTSFISSCFGRKVQCSTNSLYGSKTYKMFGVRTLYEAMKNITENELPTAENRTNPNLGKNNEKNEVIRFELRHKGAVSR